MKHCLRYFGRVQRNENKAIQTACATEVDRKEDIQENMTPDGEWEYGYICLTPMGGLKMQR